MLHFKVDCMWDSIRTLLSRDDISVSKLFIVLHLILFNLKQCGLCWFVSSLAIIKLHLHLCESHWLHTDERMSNLFVLYNDVVRLSSVTYCLLGSLQSRVTWFWRPQFVQCRLFLWLTCRRTYRKSRFSLWQSWYSLRVSRCAFLRSCCLKKLWCPLRKS